MPQELTEQWIRHPETMGADAVAQLPGIIEEYPYCATYRLLYLVALANVHSTRLKDAIRQQAPASPDLLKLFKLVNRGEYGWVLLMQQLEARRKQQTETNDFKLIERYLDDMELGAASDVQYSLEHMPDLQTERDEQDDLIDSFLQAESEGELFVPNALPNDLPENDPNELEKIKDRAFLSESLAKVYVKQGKFEQALAIFLDLNLHYSKKNSYFADQIRYLEKVIELKKTEKSNNKI